MSTGPPLRFNAHDFQIAVGAALLLALAGLTDRQRYIIASLFFLGRTEQELATELGVSRGAINQTKQRGLQTLAAALQPYQQLLEAA